MSKKWFLAAALAVATPAAAHDWYPMECCHAMDCAPVDKVEMLPGPSIASMLSTPAQADSVGGMLVTTRHGSVLVPANRDGDGTVVEGVEHRQIALARHAEDVLRAVDDQLIDQHLGGGPHVVLGAHLASPRLVRVRHPTLRERAIRAPLQHEYSTA